MSSSSLNIRQSKKKMFDRLFAHHYHEKLLHVSGDKFVKYVQTLGRTRCPDTVKYFLDILVTRTDLSFVEKAALAQSVAALGAEASHFLLGAIFDDAGKPQYNVIAALGQMRERDAVPIFSHLLDNTDDPIFALALGEIKDEAACDVLAKKLLDPKSHCRLEAFDALLSISVQGNIDILLKLQNDRLYNLRKKSASVLRKEAFVRMSPEERIINSFVLERYDEIKVVDESTARALISCAFFSEGSAAENIVEHIMNAEFDARIAICNELFAAFSDDSKKTMFEWMALHGTQGYFGLALPLLEHDNKALRASAEGYIRSLKGKGVFEAYERLLNDDGSMNLYMRTSLLALAALSDAEVVDFYHRELAQAGGGKLMLLVELLGEIGDIRSAPLLVELLKKGGERELMLLLIWAIGKCGDSSDGELIVEYLKDEERDVRFLAYETLDAINYRPALGVINEIAKQDLIEDEREWVDYLIKRFS